jgi:hypothetical protein
VSEISLKRVFFFAATKNKMAANLTSASIEPTDLKPAADRQQHA